MEVKATAKYIRISPRKVRLVVGAVRGKTVAVALDQLKFVGKLAAEPVRKAIVSAVANATHNFDLAEDNLFVKEIRVDGGPVLKRWLPRAHGRATPLMKRMSHINVTLAEIKDSGAKKARKDKIEAPVKIGHAPAKEEGVKVDEKTAVNSPDTDEKEKKIVDPRREGRAGKGGKGGKQGFTSKIFNRKAG